MWPARLRVWLITASAASARIGPKFDHIDPAKEGQGIKLQFHGMNIGRTITGNVSCDYKPKNAPGHLIAKSFSCWDELVRSDRARFRWSVSYRRRRGKLPLDHHLWTATFQSASGYGSRRCVRVAFGTRTCSTTRTWLSACRYTYSLRRCTSPTPISAQSASFKALHTKELTTAFPSLYEQ